MGCLLFLLLTNFIKRNSSKDLCWIKREGGSISMFCDGANRGTASLHKKFVITGVTACGTSLYVAVQQHPYLLEVKIAEGKIAGKAVPAFELPHADTEAPPPLRYGTGSMLTVGGNTHVILVPYSSQVCRKKINN